MDRLPRPRIASHWSNSARFADGRRWWMCHKVSALAGAFSLLPYENLTKIVNMYRKRLDGVRTPRAG